MHVSLRRARVVALSGALAAGCAGSPRIGAPEVPFRHKTHEDREAFMAAQVVPVMGKLFRKLDAKAHRNFGCETCHGKDMELVDFKMPNSLYALPEKDTIAEAEDYDKATTDFMVKEVVPTFAKLLSEKPGEPGGVSCFTCHPKE